MADKKKTPDETSPETSPETGSEATSEKSGRVGRLSIVVAVSCVLLVILVECAVAMMLLPSADEIADMAQVQLAARTGSGDLEDEVDALTDVDEGEKKEVDLGQYGVTAFQPLSNTTLRIDLHLFATVLMDDEDEFQKLFDAHENRLREQVLVILRSAEMSDLTDAGLGLIKRRILEKTNRTIGMVLVQEVIFSDFSIVEH